MKPDESRYDTRLDVKFGPLELIDEKALTDAVTHPWFNQTLCACNDSVIRVCAIKGEYHWHKHDNDDEFFYVVDGELSVDLRDRTVTLGPRQGIMVPKGTEHRTRALKRTVMLAVETKTIVPTGD
jgi:mannose-6-phosphate isomerase-like protein (cupin superfamily)